MKRAVRAATAVAATVWLLMLGWFLFDYVYLPESFSAESSNGFDLMGGLFTVRAPEDQVDAVSSIGVGGSYNASVYLFDAVPLKTVRVSVQGRPTLVPGGMAFGAKMFTEGVLVVGFTDLETSTGSYNPAQRAGLRLGDILLTVDGQQVSSNEQLAELIEQSGGSGVLMVYLRDGIRAATVVTPAKDLAGNYRVGMWVRDSTAGIGTVTFYDPQSGIIAGLGHGITDKDSGIIMPVADGEFCSVEVTGVEMAQPGEPGELIGVFTGQEIAEIMGNCETGIYGRLFSGSVSGQPLQIAYRQEIHTGAASILCCASGEVESYSVEIVSINLNSSLSTKNMVVEVTDPELLELTGGIVQGMSGSPIIQDGRLVGAVTHVFVNQPERGYGIFIENMLESAGDLAELSPAA